MPRDIARKSQAAGRATALAWDGIDTVLLDMDGTLLDLAYDNRVWNELVPRAYAQRKRIELAAAKQELLAHMGEIQGTIEFYSFDYWISYTGLDLVDVHRQATELVRYRPGALAFLRWLRASGRRAIIATNAHRDSIRVKDEFADICNEVDAVASSHDYGAPKESPLFWHSLQDQYGYQPGQAAFVDDNEPVLDAATGAGIAHVLAIITPDSERPGRRHLRFPSFDHFAEICPDIRAVEPD